MDHLLIVENLSVDFNSFKAVDQISLAVDKGELRVIIGPNGAGKTTLMDLITGKTKPTGGKVWFNGVDITGKPSHIIASKYGIGRKFQGPNLFDNLTVKANIEVAIKGYNKVWKTLTYKHTKEIEQKIDEVLAQIALLDKKDELAASLSHGQRQWLEIGMLMVQDPELIILDEPTAGMTADETYKTGEMIMELKKDHTIVVVEHDMDFVKQVAEKVTVLHMGHVIAEGSFEEVQNNPEVIQVYLKEED